MSCGCNCTPTTKTPKQCTVTISGAYDPPPPTHPPCECTTINGTHVLTWDPSAAPFCAWDKPLACDGPATLGFYIDCGGNQAVLQYAPLGIEYATTAHQAWNGSLTLGLITESFCLGLPAEVTIVMGTEVITPKPADWICHWEATETPVVATPPLCPCPCACDGGGGAAGGGSADGSPIRTFGLPTKVPEVAAYPVRYATGEIVLSHADLASGGFGMPWGHTRSFSSRLTANQDIGRVTTGKSKSGPTLPASTIA